jgi:hypothetical protein
MHATASTGYDPTAVSPLSMTASVPSKMAFATSLASARVGRGLFRIESSMSVAVMTGLPAARASAISIFCTVGTCSSGNSTPRSPRATMTASNAAMIAPARATASGRSIFASTGTSMPSARHAARTSSAASGPRTNDTATQSTPAFAATVRAAWSRSVRAAS